MAPINEETLARARRNDAARVQRREGIAAAGRGYQRGVRVAGLGLGTAVGAVGEAIPGVRKWTPDVYGSGLDAFRAFTEQVRQGDWDAAITAAQDELDAGPGYWGAAELAAEALAAPGVAGLGRGAIRAAAPLMRSQAPLARAAGTGLQQAGRAAQIPFQMEQAVGRAIGQAVSPVVAPLVAPIARRLRRGRPTPEAGTQPPLLDEVSGIPEEAVPITPETGEPFVPPGTARRESVADELGSGPQYQEDVIKQPVDTEIIELKSVEKARYDNDAAQTVAEQKSSGGLLRSFLRRLDGKLNIEEYKKNRIVNNGLKEFTRLGYTEKVGGVTKFKDEYIDDMDTFFELLHVSARDIPDNLMDDLQRRGWVDVIPERTTPARSISPGTPQARVARPEIIPERRVVKPEFQARAKERYRRRLLGDLSPNLRPLYEDVRRLADWEEANTFAFDPRTQLIGRRFAKDFDPIAFREASTPEEAREMVIEFLASATEQDYMFRGWKMGSALKAEFKRTGQIWRPGFLRGRERLSYRDFRDAGFEPISWNPYEQWGIRRMQGVRYRHQTMFLDALKTRGLAYPMDSDTYKLMPPDQAANWRTPNIGPAFEGKKVAVTNRATKVDPETGLLYEPNAIPTQGVETTNQWVVPNEVAKRLEAMYGPPVQLGKVRIFGADVDLMKAIDLATFVPKRAKLMFSLFQQQDFLTRSLVGTWSQVVDQLQAGRPVGAIKALASYPKSAYQIMQANLSPGYRLRLKDELLSRAPLVADRPNINFAGMVENGLSIRDVTIFPADINEIARDVARGAGLLGNRAVMRTLKQIESAMRRGLFDGVYPAAQMTDIKNNILPQVLRKFPNESDEAIMGMVAEIVNLKYSTIPVWQSLFQNRAMRAILQRLFFSVGESEGLLRQAAGAFKGPYQELWAKHWIGAYLALVSTASVIHFASTGKMLPTDRFVPISTDPYGPLPFGYRTKFASPTIPFTGRGETENTVDLAGQLDTAFRILDPLSFVTARESVPVRALTNQIAGKDFFGAPIDEVGPGGISSRMAAGIEDLFAPIGVGGLARGLIRQTIPRGDELLTPGEERIGTSGLLLQATGVNIRGENTRDLRNRMASESGLLIEAPNPQAGQPATEWDDLTPAQQAQIRIDRPALAKEEQARTEIQARRGQEYAQTRVERGLFEDDLVKKLDRIRDKSLSAPMQSGERSPAQARTSANAALSVFYGELYGTRWNEEKQQWEGGLYDPDVEALEPEQGTVEHLLWRYRKLYQDARDPITGELTFGEEFNEAEGKFWGSLNRQETMQVLQNTRLLEDKFPIEIQEIRQAGRYASSVEFNIQGQQGTYYELEDHPDVIAYLVAESGRPEAEIRSYLDKSPKERHDAANSLEGRIIAKAYRDAQKKDGALGSLRQRFVNMAPLSWKGAMIDAGYYFIGVNELKQRVSDELREGRTKEVFDYEQLHMQTIMNK